MEEGEEVHEVESGPKELRLVIKGDVSGSVEVVEGALCRALGTKMLWSRL
jgi:translation initiation factor IF-2